MPLRVLCCPRTLHAHMLTHHHHHYTTHAPRSPPVFRISPIRWVVKSNGDGVHATRFTRNTPPTGAWNFDACETGKNFDEAFAVCERHGLRLCTKDEVASDVGAKAGCNTGSNLQWTSTPCDGNGDNPDDGDTIAEELDDIKKEYATEIAAEEPLDEEGPGDSKYECTTAFNFIEGNYHQIEIKIAGQTSRKIFDESEAVAYCKQQCDKRDNCKAFWYQRHPLQPNHNEGPHGYKLCAFYTWTGCRDKSKWRKHGHGGLSQVCAVRQ
jgi:hypothetical protein